MSSEMTDFQIITACAWLYSCIPLLIFTLSHNTEVSCFFRFLVRCICYSTTATFPKFCSSGTVSPFNSQCCY